MKSSEYPEEFPRIFQGNTKFGFLGIYRRNSEEILIRRNILMEYRGKMYSSKKTDEFRGYIIAVREPLEDFKNSEEIPRKEPLPSIFRRNFLGLLVVSMAEGLSLRFSAAGVWSKVLFSLLTTAVRILTRWVTLATTHIWWIRCTVLSNSREVVVKETNEAKMLRAENSCGQNQP
ncbi:hypothetical protein DY000_02049507 [Brassica cretica]|uniref:Uncharacterized protein n=1 Tax=Brassica cretica TaxID=69181 RepID=A0ABQ7EXZ5_BRACR|nr:hypothetical protein DY000_02049507 [Brassica cretica]